MDQRIFKMGLSVEATSLYLLMVSLSQGGANLDRATLENFWNASSDQLDTALNELIRRQVIDQLASGHWHLRPNGEWLQE